MNLAARAIFVAVMLWSSVASALPVVSSVAPIKGAAGTLVSITGRRLLHTYAVHFGMAYATFVVNSSTRIMAVAPPHAPGLVKVTVTTPAGTSKEY